ncbi:MAG: ABC transporter permease [Clostridiales bacterium]|nr:ABC transporter permease [Clostridiales bacterium]
MKNLRNALKSDILFQFRHGFYFVYLAISVLYVVVFFQLPDNVLPYVIPAVIFSDPSIIGFIFIGVIFMLEKEQGIFSYLSITPLSLAQYMLSKIFSLAILGLSASLLMAIVMGIAFNPFVLFIASVLSSCFFSLIGLYVVCSAKSIIHFLYKMIPIMILIMLPAIAMFDIPHTGFLKIFPTYTGLQLILGAYNKILFVDALYYSANLLLFCVIAFFITRNRILKKMYGR